MGVNLQQFLSFHAERVSKYLENHRPKMKIESKPGEHAGAQAHTDADDEAQEMWLRDIKVHFPHHSVHPEENTPTVNKFKKDSDWMWYMDCLDGTLSYMQHDPDPQKSNPHYGGWVAVAYKGKPVASTIYLPELGKTYVGIDDRCFLNGKPFAIKPFTPPKPVILHGPEKSKLVKKLEYSNIPTTGKPQSAAASFDEFFHGKASAVVLMDWDAWDTIAGVHMTNCAGGYSHPLEEWKPWSRDKAQVYLSATSQKTWQVLATLLQSPKSL